ncbi:MAG: Gfo/Idh/MocA family protein [Candidatus Methylomirabilales bacterium]
MPLNWIVVGAGDIASNQFVPALSSLPSCRILAVIDKNLEAARTLAARCGAPHALADVQEIRRLPEADAVYVATWPALHCEHVLLAAGAGKHVFCEKPMAVSLAECDRMILACRDAKVRLMIGNNQRFHAAHQKVKQLVREGAIGPIVLARLDFLTSFRLRQGERFRATQYRLTKGLGGGGVIMDMAIHGIDLVRYVLDDQVTAVGCFHDHLVYDSEAEDTAVLQLRFARGTLGTISVSGGIPYGRNALELYSDRGAILSERSLARVPDEPLVRVLLDGVWTEHRPTGEDSFRAEIQRFVTAIQGAAEVAVPGEEGKADLAVALAAYRSMQEGRLVQLAEMA